MKSALRALTALVAATTLCSQSVSAQSVLRDAETEAVFAEIAAPIVKAAGLQPKNVQIVLVHDKSINAFVATGQAVYVHSGLIAAADNANQVQGVLAHEIGHISGGHSVRFNEGANVAMGISLLTLVAGIAAAALGAGDAGAAIISAGQQAALGKFLAFSREQESRADQAGATYLAKAGISGKGSLAFFKKLQNQEFRYSVPQDDGYGRTHPLSGERISILFQRYSVDPAWTKTTDPAVEARFQRIKAKLKGFVSEPRQTMVSYPERDQSLPGHYARAYAWHRAAYPDKALAESNALLAKAPHDPYFLELKGQILLESGRPQEAIPLLREANTLTFNHPLIALTFGHALIATDNKANFAEAERVLKAAVNKENDNPFAWYQLGVVYEARGDHPRAALATAESYQLRGQARLALRFAQEALRGLPKGTPDSIRAQDIVLVAGEQAANEKGRRR